MPKMELFFDYACPFCKSGFEDLLSLIGEYPQIEIVWCPCEAHPRPEPGPYSDLALQALLFAVEAGADIIAFNTAMYKAILTDRIPREDIGAIVSAVSHLVDGAALTKALESRSYEAAQQALNDHAYEKSGVWVIPAYRSNGKKLDSIGGVGVIKEDLDAYLKEICEAGQDG